MGGGSDQIKGYKYYFGILMGISRGGVDQIVEIRVGDKMAWPIQNGNAPLAGPHPSDLGVGSGNKPPDSGGLGGFTGGWNSDLNGEMPYEADYYDSIYDTIETRVEAPTLFGGDKGEGGIQGRLMVMMGKADQVVPNWIKNIIGGDVPDFRGVTTMFFNGLVCSMNPYPKPWKVRARRSRVGWDGGVWLPDLATIVLKNGAIHAMNPAHILYESATNREWGRGLPRTRIGSSFERCARQLYNEKFGLCMRYNRQEDLSTFTASVINHIAGTAYTSRETGLLEMSLVRNDYDPEDLPHFDYDSGLLEISEAEVSSRDDLVNEVIVKYRDPIRNEERSVRVHNLASIQSTGVPNSNTTEYPGIPVGDLATRVAARDMKVGSLSNRRYDVKLDRAAWRLVPGGAFRVSAPDKKIKNLVLRAGKVSQGGIDKGEIVIVALPDIFGLPAVSFSEPEESTWQQPDRRPLPPKASTVKEASYRDLFMSLSRANFAQIGPDEAYVVAYAIKPTSLARDFSIYSKTSVETDFVERGRAPFCPGGIMRDRIGSGTTSLTIKEIFDFSLIKTPCGALIDNEIVRVDSLTLAEDGSATALITRGCVDTVPAVHQADTPVFFIDRRTGFDKREYAASEQITARVSTNTSSGSLPLSKSPSGTVTTTARQGKPYPAANVKINGTSIFSTPEADTKILVEWSHRNRVVQQDQLTGYFEPSLVKEDGVTYTIEVSQLGTKVRTVTGISGASWTYTATMATADKIDKTETVGISLYTVKGTAKSDVIASKSLLIK